MSIIHDALKKTQNKLKHKEKNAAPKDELDYHDEYNTINKPEAPIETPSNNTAHRPILFALICIAVSIIIASALLAPHLKALVKNTKIVVQEKAPVIEASKPVKSIPLAKPKVEPTTSDTAMKVERLVLTGTMMTGDKRVALINDDIYEVGEFIDDLVVNAITLTEVELLDKNGNTLSIKVKK